MILQIMAHIMYHLGPKHVCPRSTHIGWVFMGDDQLGQIVVLNGLSSDDCVIVIVIAFSYKSHMC